MVHHVLLLTRLALHACGRRNTIARRPQPWTVLSLTRIHARSAEAPGLPTGLLTVLDEDKNTHHPTSASSFSSHSSVDSVSSSSFFLATSLSSLFHIYLSPLHRPTQDQACLALPCLSLPQRFNCIKTISRLRLLHQRSRPPYSHPHGFSLLDHTSNP